jgi:HEPN domain-containing protein
MLEAYKQARDSLNNAKARLQDGDCRSAMFFAVEARAAIARGGAHERSAAHPRYSSLSLTPREEELYNRKLQADRLGIDMADFWDEWERHCVANLI